MVVFDPNTQEYYNAPEPARIRVPFLQRPMGAGDIVAAATSAMGVKPCGPCEERKRKMNQRVQFTPWRERHSNDHAQGASA